MIRELLTNLHWSTLPTLGMMLFLTLFVGCLLWVYRKGSEQIYQKISQLPLENETLVNENGGVHE